MTPRGRDRNSQDNKDPENIRIEAIERLNIIKRNYFIWKRNSRTLAPLQKYSKTEIES